MKGVFTLIRHIVVALAGLAAIVTPVWFLVAALGGKFDLWAPIEGFRHVRSHAGMMLASTLGLGIAALVVAVVYRLVFGAKNSPGAGGYVAGIAAIIVGAGGILYAQSVTASAREVPPIHDISTDLQDPPQFSQALIERRTQSGASNSTDLLAKTVPDADWTGQWGGRPVTEVQAEAYPDIDSIVLEAAPDSAFAAALDVARNMGWRVTSASRESLMFEGTAETFWFGFEDDVVVRVRPGEGGGSVVDIRSVSRVGVSDLGANAARIEQFEERLRGSVGEEQPAA